MQDEARRCGHGARHRPAYGRRRAPQDCYRIGLAIPPRKSSSEPGVGGSASRMSDRTGHAGSGDPAIGASSAGISGWSSRRSGRPRRRPASPGSPPSTGQHRCCEHAAAGAARWPGGSSIDTKSASRASMMTWVPMSEWRMDSTASEHGPALKIEHIDIEAKASVHGCRRQVHLGRQRPSAADGTPLVVAQLRDFHPTADRDGQDGAARLEVERRKLEGQVLLHSLVPGQPRVPSASVSSATGCRWCRARCGAGAAGTAGAP